MSVNRRAEVVGVIDGVFVAEYGSAMSIGAKAGMGLSESRRMLGSCIPEPYSSSLGYNLGECAGVARGVCSGVGEHESWEKVGEDGAVEIGEVGRERFAALWAR
ncbi:hypothetical protein ABW19_dt0208557 [Dactylella cylindrospora]|nr:hypothetical protein ABW19_dt0208557 [Dactylella cylindrospora]